MNTVGIYYITGFSAPKWNFAFAVDALDKALVLSERLLSDNRVKGTMILPKKEENFEEELPRAFPSKFNVYKR